MNQVKTDFVEIFQTIRASLQPYAVMGFDNRENSETTYDLWSNRNVEIEGQKKNEVFFASVVIEKNQVVFNLMPVYAEADLKSASDPALLKLLKGKSGFQVKELDEDLLSQVESSLAEGFKIFKEKGWV